MSVYRYIAELSIVDPPRSLCPHCGHTLQWWENIPILSYVLLLGRCSTCKKAIDVMYPLIEICSAIWGGLLAYKYGFGATWAVYMFFGGLFLFASFVDFAIYILPDRVTLLGIPLALVSNIIINPMDYMTTLEFYGLGALCGGGTFWVMQQLYRIIRKQEGLGTGDVKLMFTIGALVGPIALPLVVTIASVSGLFASGFYMIREGDGAQSRVPFGPFLCLGAMVVLLYESEIWRFVS